mgnify:CR=1 FL=1
MLHATADSAGKAPILWRMLAVPVNIMHASCIPNAPHVQISKLLIIPFVCLVEFAWFNRTFTGPMVGSILVVVVGVAVV